MPNRPFIYPLKTPLGNYFYDVNRNQIVAVDHVELYDAICSYWETGVIPPNAAKTIELLQKDGLLSTEHPEKMQHPALDTLEYRLKHNIEHITMQITQQCNFRCSYCVYTANDYMLQREHSSKKVTWEMAKRIIDFYFQNSLEAEYPNIGFYGGEPLLEFDLLKKAMLYAEELFEGRELSFTTTTNASLLTREKVEFLKEHNILVMISLDGMPEVHDRSRKFAANGKGTYAAIEKNLLMIAEEYPDFFQKLRVNVVVDSRYGCDALYRFFLEHPLFSKLSIRSNLIDDQFCMEKTVITEQYYAENNRHIFKAMMSELGRYPKEKVSPLVQAGISSALEPLRKSLLHNNMGKTMSHGGPCVPGEHRLFITVDGEFYPCERVSETSPVMRIGSIDEGFDYEQAKKVLNVAQLTEEECKNCWAIQHCSTCAKYCDNNGELSAEMKRLNCPKVLSTVEYNFRDYLLYMELKKEGTNEHDAG